MVVILRGIEIIVCTETDESCEREMFSNKMFLKLLKFPLLADINFFSYESQHSSVGRATLS